MNRFEVLVACIEGTPQFIPAESSTASQVSTSISAYLRMSITNMLLNNIRKCYSNLCWGKK